MDILHCFNYVDEDAHDKCFRHKLWLFSMLINLLNHISVRTILHQQQKLVPIVTEQTWILVQELIMVRYNVSMLEFPELFSLHAYFFQFSDVLHLKCFKDQSLFLILFWLRLFYLLLFCSLFLRSGLYRNKIIFLGEGTGWPKRIIDLIKFFSPVTFLQQGNLVNFAKTPTADAFA